MEEDNLILKNWRQQEKLFIENLLISRKRPTKDSVHDLRVAVKRMRSYLRLKQQINGGEWKESFSKFTDLFKSFGRLRDIDMALDLARKSERKENLSFPFFKEYLSVNRSLARRWAKQDAIKFNEDEPKIFNRQFKLDLTDEGIVEKIIHFSKEKIRTVKKLSRHFQKNAHEIRKQLKDIYYWLKICPKEIAESIVDMKALDRMLTYLGSWQDHFIFRKKIKQYVKDLAKKGEEKEMLMTHEKKLVTIQKDILDKARKKWKDVAIKKPIQMNRPNSVPYTQVISG